MPVLSKKLKRKRERVENHSFSGYMIGLDITYWQTATWIRPILFMNSNYKLFPLKIQMNHMDILSSLWGHFTGPSHNTSIPNVPCSLTQHLYLTFQFTP